MLPPLPACDWATTGTDCSVFAAGDVNGDGFPDILTINGNRDLCWAPSVHGWKSGGWRVLVGGVDPAAKRMQFVVPAAPDSRGKIVVEYADRTATIPLDADGKPGAVESSPAVWKESAKHADAQGASPAPSPPPYDPQAKLLCQFESAACKEGGTMQWAVFDCTLPHPYRVVRNAIARSADPADSDADGLTDAEEKTIGTDPHCRDTDDDGFLDGWEVHGLPADRVKELGPRITLFSADAKDAAADAQLDPRRRDVIVNISYFEQVDRKAFEGQMPAILASYRALNIKNPDGSTGVWLHLRDIAAPVGKDDQKMPWWDVGGKFFPRSERGLMHWMQVTPWGGGQSSETGDMGGSGNGWAVFVHELGHQLSLSHTGDSAPGWCPLYPSLMNYAYSYSFDGDGSKPHFSNGEFRAAVLDEHHLRESLPFPYERVKFLANRPYRFTLKDKGDGTTLIDWNHNGTFDETEVVADVNYGGSTHAGDRKTHALIGSSPSMAYIAGKCFLAAATPKQSAITVKMHKGNEEWTDNAEAGSSASRVDPVLIGGPDYGVLLVRRFDAWAAAKITPGAAPDAPPAISALQTIPGLVVSDLSGIRIGDRVLLIGRHDSGATETRWLTFGDKPAVTDPVALKLIASVPPGLAVNPNDNSITVVSSGTHPKHGPYSLQLSTLTINGDEVVEGPAEWTHGGGHCHCTSRPIAVYPSHGGAPQLTIFHTGWVDGNGCWTGWRTQRVGNKSLDDGWLTSQLYDEWTRSRAAIGFADGPDGAFYAFRWDPGDHRDWKVNTMFVSRGGYGIDDQPMRDFDDGAKIGNWGIRHSILTMPTDEELK